MLTFKQFIAEEDDDISVERSGSAIISQTKDGRSGVGGSTKQGTKIFGMGHSSVHPNDRGRGVGTRLYHALWHHALNNDHDEIHSDGKPSSSAQRVYDSKRTAEKFDVKKNPDGGYTVKKRM